MGRKSIEVKLMDNQTVDELIDKKNSTENNRERLILATIIMRYLKYSNKEIMKITGLSQSTIISYINNWNAEGFAFIEDKRGGSIGKLSSEIVEDLIYTTKHVSPTEKGFIANTWSCALLAIYINQKYGIKVTDEAIRLRLIENNISYKRAQPKPSKADKDKQEAFKKNAKQTIYFRIFI